MDALLNSLKSSNYGCHVGKLYVACLAYADDLILLSASIGTLQKVHNVCE